MIIWYQNINYESALGSKIETQEKESGHMFLKNHIVGEFIIGEFRIFREK